MVQELMPGKERQQQFSWGQISWLQSASGLGLGKLNFGIVTVYQETTQVVHNHYADEQILYGLEGVSKQVINGKEHLLAPGTWLYIPPYANHGIINVARQPARFILVACPVWRPEEETPEAQTDTILSFDYATYFLSQTNLREVQETFASASGLGVALVDPAGVRLTEPTNLPAFCHYCSSFHGQCQLLARRGMGPAEKIEWIKCEQGLVAARLPVQVQGTNVINVLCGFVFLTLPPRTEQIKADLMKHSASHDPEQVLQSYLSIPQVTRNRLFAAAELLRVTAFSLANLFLAAAKESEIKEYRWRLLQEQQERVLVEADLQKTKIRLIEAQVNPHFLFNTLNTIAQSAVLQGAATTAELVYALAELLRFSLRKVGSFVTLQEELQYIENYLYIQRQRFGDRFSFLADVPEELKKIVLPAVTLQPLVENAFAHGFAVPRDKDGRLLIVVSRRDEKLVQISISDNGCGITPERLAEVQGSLVDPGISPPGIGIRGVYWRLKHYFGSQADLNIHSLPDNGTTVLVVLPLMDKSPDTAGHECQ